MIIYKGNIDKLANLPWRVLIRAQHTKDTSVGADYVTSQIMRALGRHMRKHPDCMEVFVPDEAQYLFVRSDSTAALERLTRVRGIVGFVQQGMFQDQKSFSSAITVPDEQVQPMIALARQAHELRTVPAQGDFVRIREGRAAKYCGTITRVNKGMATVRVEMQSRDLTVQTPTANLEDLTDVPEFQQMFYYCPAVANL